jgi:hypothetical protein
LKKFRISLRFYRSLAPFSVLVTLACAWTLVNLDDLRAIPLLAFFKVLTLFLFLLFIGFLRPHELYYYYNLNLSKAALWGTAAVVDLSLFALVLWLTSNLFLS